VPTPTSRPAARPTDLLDPVLPAVTVSAAPLPDVLVDLESPDVTMALLIRPAADNGRPVGLDPLTTLGLDVDELAATHEPSTKGGRTSLIPLAPGSRSVRRILTVGLGDEPGGTAATSCRRAGAELGRATRGVDEVVLVVDAAVEAEGAAALVEGFVLGGWTVPRWTAQEPTTTVPSAGRLTVLSDATGVEEAVRRAVVRARATLVARCLGVTPSNVKNPAWLAARARTLARRSGLTVTVWSERELATGGFGGLLAVGGGSATPPRLVQLDWTPDAQADPRSLRHVVLVGKGITFDTGGLDIKPADGMLAMKTDMMGAAAVAAALAACRDLGIAVRVTGLLALAENAVSGSAYRPSDVITQAGGTTVEIGNTDAEGRIVLADALAYAVEQLTPDAVVDIATLTGAARVAFARTMAPVFATDPALRDALVAAGETEGETLWPLPLPAAYRGALDSDVADLKQISGAHGAGSIMAALFLREFVGETPWAHLDIAGPGRSDVDAGALAKGPTGFGTRALLRWLEGLR
jgi:leucyl aminopeptidase